MRRQPTRAFLTSAEVVAAVGEAEFAEFERLRVFVGQHEKLIISNNF